MFKSTESTYGDGDWIFQLRNEKVNDLQVESFIIRLLYRYSIFYQELCLTLYAED